MAKTNRINISKERYRWAIQRAGYTVDDYINSHPKIAVYDWMEGNRQPTIKQLEDFSKSVNVPFGFLFLEDVPIENIPFPVFRGDSGRYDHFDLNVYDTVNTVLQRQNWLEDYIVENGIDTCKFVGCATTQTTIAEAVSILRTNLNLDARWAFALTNTNAAINKLTEMLEDAGVFLAYNGVVGNNTHRILDVKECRGFALVNQVAPYIFINNGDAPTAQLFTLIHEAAHLMLGVSAGHAETNTLCMDATENWCDRVAAEFLVPAAELQTLWNGCLGEMCKKFKVSELVIARRGHDLGLMSNEEYRMFWAEYSTRPRYMRKKDNSGGSFYRTSLKRVGRLFAIHVKNAVSSRQLSYTQAYRLTGLYGNTYTQFMNNNI